MQQATKELLKELIEFYEACGRNKKKTTSHFVASKKASKLTIIRLLRRYNREGSAILETKPRKSGKYLEKLDRVLELLKEDPTVSVREGAQILGISNTTFARLKTTLLTPGQLTTERDSDIQSVKAPHLPQDEVGGANLSSEPESEVNIKLDESNCGAADLDYGDDDVLEDCRFENDYKPGPTTTDTFASCKKGKKMLRHCLVCYRRLDSKDEDIRKTTCRRRSQRYNLSIAPLPPLSFALYEDDGALGENLNVIFALKHVFGLNSSDLVKFMEVSKGKDPVGWYHLCCKCDGIMKEAVTIQHKVLQLTRDLEKCKSRIMEKIKESCGKANEVKHEDSDLKVTKLIRQSVCPRRKRKLRADHSIHVKSEPEEANLNECESFGGVDDHESFGNDESVRLETDSPIGGTFANDPSLTATAATAVICNPREDLTMKPKLVVCDLCGDEMRLFSLPLHTLRVHGVLMDGYTEFKCPEEGCQYKTVYKSNLVDHSKKVHVPLNMRKWACQLCGRKFKCKAHLSDHERIHQNAHTRPYQCEICGQGFAVYPTLWNHIKGVHQGRVNPYRKGLMGRKKRKITSHTSTRTDCETESSNQHHENETKYFEFE